MKKIISSIVTIIVILTMVWIAFENMETELLCPIPEIQGSEEKFIDVENQLSTKLLNEYREENNLEPLKYNFSLYYSALKSAKMIYTGDLNWSHYSYQDLISEYYEDWKMIGENLAKDFDNQPDVFEAWKNSPDHDKILLSKIACEYGLANYGDVYVLHIGCKEKLSRWGLASYYSREGCIGCSETLTMANGEPLDDSKITVAYNQAPLNSNINITNVRNGRTVTAKVTDRGGFERHGKIVDLSVATKEALGCGDVCKVEIKL